MSLFEKTFDVTEEDKPQTQDFGTRVFTFGLNKGESAKVVFINEEPPSKCYVHNIYGGPKFDSPWDMACIKALTKETCPFCKFNAEIPADCASRFAKKPIWIYPIIDLRPYEITKGDKKGTIIPYSRKALVVKSGSQEAIQKQFSTRREAGETNRAGICFEFSRSDKDKAPRCGDSFAYFNQRDLSDFDDKVLKPFSQEELESLVLCDAGKIMSRYEQCMSHFNTGTGSSEESDETGPQIDYANVGDEEAPF
jgi:hypothetical protein